MIFYAWNTQNNTESRIEIPTADQWTIADWAFMNEQARVNPNLKGTVSAAGIIQLWDTMVSQGKIPDAYTIGTWLGGSWLSATPVGTITSISNPATGETWTPTYVGETPPQYVLDWFKPAVPIQQIPPTISGPIAPTPTTAVPGPTSINAGVVSSGTVPNVAIGLTPTDTNPPVGTLAANDPQAQGTVLTAAKDLVTDKMTTDAKQRQLMIVAGAVVLLLVVVYMARK